ncbi:site-specific recombinase XerD [Natranaerovirga hydrolytica]|uniref:Site-specific recombinase XerD n=1 Tax=Natranaerovirga hydrolytica TaxID=680378 RepID=A0A4R1MXM9_9FIRM|nr:tyrosine-type recombinase/integrase [Natranaerovirga hydrolytica]TCK98028.1 site-specific recombinase XerD [Natranaerovirga hydrolytica]
MYEIYRQSLIKEMELRGYSPRSIESYSKYLIRFLHFTNKPVDSLVNEDLKSFLHHLIAKKLSTSYINSVYSSVHLFFTLVLKKSFSLTDVPRVKNSKKLPVVLSRSEVDQIISATSNLKHRAILMTTYSAGLRVSEAVRLKVSDVDSKNMQLHIHSGKSDKDRYAILSHQNLLLLREYYKVYRPTDWLFPSGANSSMYLTSRTVQKTFKASTLKAGILKPVTVHTLRHSFATHLLIAGTDIYTIMQLLGHNSIQTTSVYLHLALSKVLSVASPLDREVSDFE